MVGGLLFSFFIALTSFKPDKVAYRIRKMENGSVDGISSRYNEGA